MDHIADEFGLPPNAILGVPVLNSIHLEPPTNWEAFHDHPQKWGWALDENYHLRLSQGTVEQTVELEQFVQSWLFFGLICTVVQKDGHPILSCKDLIGSSAGGTVVHTKQLNRAIEEWKAWECAHPQGIRLRMVRIERILDIARRTVRENYSHSSSSSVCSDYIGDIKRDKLALSLMVLGETISSAKTKIMKETKSGLRGWHSDDDSGWGRPEYIFNRMMENWCPRTVYLWKNQLRSNATMLLASYFAHESNDRVIGENHKHCDQHNCYVISHDDKTGKYQSTHAYGCRRMADCVLRGPNMKVVKEYLSEDRIPLLQFEGPPLTNMEDENLNITVTKWTEIKSMPEKFATISHVWSDGYGNEEENALHRCQLRYIKRLLNDVGQEGGLGWRTPFWMDTLIIPVGKGEEEKKLRKRAIKQIFRIFKESSYTIVLDVGLSRFNLDGTDKPAVAAMRILGSSWMRRLWTLQEAFLSRKIYFAFEESASPRSYLKDLAGISQRLASESPTEVTTALLNMVNEHLQRMIMSHENETRDKYLFKKQGTEAQDMPARKAAILVASTWRAARWRTTTNSFHETLALATLLDLNHEDNEIAEAGLLQEKRPTQADTKLRGEQTAKKDKLVREFWTEFNKRWPESIPPGIIFLSGERVELEGFGWAPRTWMTAQPVDPPDPLAVMRSTARLDTNRLRGLKVRYPGFLLDAQDRKQILATDQQKTPRFWFPTGPSFLDWYMVEPADDIPQIYLQKIEESDHPLAIIVSRARPGNSPSEIGLLVQIRESIEQNQEDEEENPLFCEIIRRVKISRETRAQFRTRNRSRFLYTEHHEASNQESLRPPHNGTDASNSGSRQDNLEVPEVMISSAMDKRICIAEELESDQVWYVDGYIPRIDEKLSSFRASNKQDNEPRAGRFEGFLRIFNPKSSFGARGSGNFDAKNSRSAKVNVPEIGHSKTIRRTGSVVEQPTTVKQPAWTGFKSIISK